MRQIIVALGVTFLLATAGLGYSQSLADLAKKEKERREKVKVDAKVIDNINAGNYRSGAVTTVTLPPTPSSAKTDSEKGVAGPALGPAKPAADEPVDLQGRPESFWRQTLADARKRVSDLENQATVLVLRLADLQTRFYRESDGFRQQAIQREIQKTFYEQDLTQENLAKAKDHVQDLEKEARKSGALPGWLSPKSP